MAEFERTGEGLAVRGPLDAGAEAEFRRHLAALLEGGAETVTLDLSGVDLITSSCIGALVAFWIDLRPAGRRFRVVPSPAVTKVLDMTGLAGVFAKAASARRKADGGQD